MKKLSLKNKCFTSYFFFILLCVSFLKVNLTHNCSFFTYEIIIIIIIYGSPDCHYCTDLKESLSKKQMAFVFFDIDKDQVALNQMLTKLKNANISTNNLQIPVVDKYGQIYVNNADFKDFIIKITE